jgi:hypothetical protein
LLVSILKFIQSLPNRPTAAEGRNESIMILLRLFQTVSASVFDWKPFFQLIGTMRPINNCCPWWNMLLIPSVTNLVSLSSSIETPSSFFHFTGQKTQTSSMD